MKGMKGYGFFWTLKHIVRCRFRAHIHNYSPKSSLNCVLCNTDTHLLIIWNVKMRYKNVCIIWFIINGQIIWCNNDMQSNISKNFNNVEFSLAYKKYLITQAFRWWIYNEYYMNGIFCVVDIRHSTSLEISNFSSIKDLIDPSGFLKP